MEKQFRIYTQDRNTGELEGLPTKNLTKLWWGFPAVFTLSKAQQLFANKPTLLKRLSGLRPGSTFVVGSISRNTSLVIKVDDSYDQDNVDQLQSELDEVNAEINRVAGDLLRRRKELQVSLKNARGE